jgi:hypothetical protein
MYRLFIMLVATMAVVLGVYLLIDASHMAQSSSDRYKRINTIE